MKIDLSKKPDGATHYMRLADDDYWYRAYDGVWDYWSGMVWVAVKQPVHLVHALDLDRKSWTGEGLPVLGSTVRIIDIGLPVWPEAEKFFGADCTLCAVFMTGDTQMVAVEHQADAVCCCFVADMVRTPEQIEQHELREALEELAPHIAGYMGRDDPEAVDVGLAAYLLDHGYRKQLSP